MASSEVQICNNALIKLGANTITSLSDDSKAARLCNNVYSIMRDDMLRGHPWNFAITRTTLAKLSTTPAFKYSYEYQLPSDCLRVIGIKDTNAEYRIEGRKLLTDENSVSLIYIKRITDTSQFDANFANALAFKLASELAYAITNNATLASNLGQEAERLLRRAKMHDAQEDSMYVIQTDALTGARSGFGIGGIVFESEDD